MEGPVLEIFDDASRSTSSAGAETSLVFNRCAPGSQINSWRGAPRRCLAAIGRFEHLHHWRNCRVLVGVITAVENRRQPARTDSDVETGDFDFWGLKHYRHTVSFISIR